MHKKLQEVAEISSGYTFRGSIENNPKGDVFVLQAKNMAINENIQNFEGYSAILSTTIRNPYFLQYNDVLLVSRGSGAGSFRSAVFVSDNNNVVASSSAHIIRITDITVLPKYVSLYLNSLEGQKALLQIVTGGSYIQSILIKNLADMKIPIPPIHIQKFIIALHENVIEQEKILEKKSKIKQNIINSTFTSLINK